MIIDAHNHLGLRANDDEETLNRGLTEDDFLQLMEGAGIDKAVITPLFDRYGDYQAGNALLAEVIQAHPDRFLGFVRVDPYRTDQALEMIEEGIVEKGFYGIKMHPRSERFHLDDEVVNPIFEAAIDLEVPVLIHGGETNYCHPLLFGRIAERFPAATIIMGHMGKKEVSRGIEMAEEFSNIILETSSTGNPKTIEKAVERVGAERVVFGTDIPFFDPRVEIKKIRLLDVEPKIKSLILGENMRRILNLD